MARFTLQTIESELKAYDDGMDDLWLPNFLKHLPLDIFLTDPVISFKNNQTSLSDIIKQHLFTHPLTPQNTTLNDFQKETLQNLEKQETQTIENFKKRIIQNPNKLLPILEECGKKRLLLNPDFFTFAKEIFATLPKKSLLPFGAGTLAMAKPFQKPGDTPNNKYQP
ncbi:MAG: hypothetical protein ACNA7Y_04980 [Gammaproteobacteria bacterium]